MRTLVRVRLDRKVAVGTNRRDVTAGRDRLVVQNLIEPLSGRGRLVTFDRFGELSPLRSDERHGRSVSGIDSLVPVEWIDVRVADRGASGADDDGLDRLR